MKVPEEVRPEEYWVVMLDSMLLLSNGGTRYQVPGTRVGSEVGG